ncbi:MAG: SDR family oxidoreductase [Acidobacteriota bacterium]
MIIRDQPVVITGAASGLGLAFARRLSRLGARVWGLDRDETAIDRLRRDPAYARIEFVRCDVGIEQEVASVVGDIEKRSGGIGVLVNNAAVLRDQTLVSKLGRTIRKHSLADWDETLRSNLTGSFLMAREVAEMMIRGRRGGLIVNISSISRAGNPGQTAYAATKAALDALTVTWAQELATYGIRVVALAPGFAETNLTSRIPPLFLERIRDRTPLKRFGTLEEFERAIEFIVENDYLNGKVLELDGGLRF